MNHADPEEWRQALRHRIIFDLETAARDLLVAVHAAPAMTEQRLEDLRRNGIFPKAHQRIVEHGEILFYLCVTCTIREDGTFLHLSLSREDHKRLGKALCEPFRRAIFGDRETRMINAPGHQGYCYQFFAPWHEVGV